MASYGIDSYGGKWMHVSHDSLGLTTFYLHFDQFNQDLITRYNRGETVRVSTNTLLGTMGASGLATGPHLHFEIRKGEEKLDPKTTLNGVCKGTGPENVGEEDNGYPDLMKKALKLDNWYESLIDLIFDSPNMDEEWERLSNEEKDQFLEFLESDNQGQSIFFEEFREKIKINN